MQPRPSRATRKSDSERPRLSLVPISDSPTGDNKTIGRLIAQTAIVADGAIRQASEKRTRGTMNGTLPI